MVDKKDGGPSIPMRDSAGHQSIASVSRGSIITPDFAMVPGLVETETIFASEVVYAVVGGRGGRREMEIASHTYGIGKTGKDAYNIDTRDEEARDG